MSAGRAAPRRDGSGFTLVELMMVVSIMGMVAALAVPGLNALLAREPLDEATAETVAVLRQARLEAARSGRSVGVTLSSEGDGLWLGEVYTGLGGGVRASAGLRERTIRFHPTGVSAGGPWRLRDTGGRTLLLEVEPVTGALRLWGEAPTGAR